MCGKLIGTCLQVMDEIETDQKKLICQQNDNNFFFCVQFDRKIPKRGILYIGYPVRARFLIEGGTLGRPKKNKNMKTENAPLSCGYMDQV